VALEIEGSNPSVHPKYSTHGGSTMTQESNNPDPQAAGDKPGDETAATEPAPPEGTANTSEPPEASDPRPWDAWQRPKPETGPAGSASAVEEASAPTASSESSARSSEDAAFVPSLPSSENAPAEPVASTERPQGPPPDEPTPPTSAPADAEPSETPSEPGSPEPVATTEASPPPPEEPTPPVPQPPPKRGKAWLLLIPVAIIPAVVVGLAVYFLAGNDGGDDNAAGIVDGLIQLGGTEETTTTSYQRELPPDFTTDFPVYKNADVVVSFAIGSQQGTSYLVVLSTNDPATEVYDYYSRALDEGPWQVEIGRTSEDFTGLGFTRPDNINVSGDVTMFQSDLDNRTAIYVSYDDMSKAVTPGQGPFTLGAGRALPAGFPKDVPIYQGDEESLVIDSYFERGQGAQGFIVTFLTRNTQDDVLTFYRDQLQDRGWNVTDSAIDTNSFALGVDFNDGNTNSISGSITTNAFEKDSSFTQVDMMIQVSPTRTRGN
jgi:hypothetical protein